MSTKEWAAVGLVIGAGILLPILSSDDAMVMDTTAMEMPTSEAAGPMKTVALDVTGMT
jgi:hypothetical protein